MDFAEERLLLQTTKAQIPPQKHDATPRIDSAKITSSNFLKSMPATMPSSTHGRKIRSSKEPSKISRKENAPFIEWVFAATKNKDRKKYLAKFLAYLFVNLVKLRTNERVHVHRVALGQSLSRSLPEVKQNIHDKAKTDG